MSIPTGNSATQTIILGLFLKLLGFFIVLYSYADTQPVKLQQAQHSIHQQFGVTLPLTAFKQGDDQHAENLVQHVGKSFDAIESDMTTAFDFLAVAKNVTGEEIYLHVPADAVMYVNGRPPKSSDFAAILTRIIADNTPPGIMYHFDLIAKGDDLSDLSAGIAGMAQNFILSGLPDQNIKIGFEKSNAEPKVTIILKAVQR